MSGGHDKGRVDSGPGAAIYSARALRAYDLVVHGISNTFAWKCPTPELLDLYNRNVSARHMDIGVGSGYFLDRCRFPVPDPRIALVDLNEDALRFASDRIRRYRPSTHVADVLSPLAIEEPEPFRSVGLMYLLHCLPGDMSTKAAVIRNVRPLVAEDGVVFGATILARAASENVLARALMRFYNARGIFGNAGDTVEGLERALTESFARVSIVERGSVALFTAREPRPAP